MASILIFRFLYLVILFGVLLINNSCKEENVKPMANFNVKVSTLTFDASGSERICGKDISTGKTLYCRDGIATVPIIGGNQVGNVLLTTIADLDLIRLVDAVTYLSNTTFNGLVYCGVYTVAVSGGFEVRATFRNLQGSGNPVLALNYQILYTKV